jgi:hypothetical protein
MDTANTDSPEDHHPPGSLGGTPPTIETNTHVFIVKLWLDEIDAMGQAFWRGHITHVPSGARRYFDNLTSIESILGPYLEALGVRRVRNHTLNYIKECFWRLWGGR